MKTFKKSFLAVSTAAALVFAPAGHTIPVQLGFSQVAGFVQDVDFNTELDPTEPQGLKFKEYGEAVPDDGTINTAPANVVDGFSWEGILDGPESSIGITSYNSQTSLSNGATYEVFGFIAGDLNSNNQWNEGEFWIIDQLTQTNEVLTVQTGAVIFDPTWTANTLANLRFFTDNTLTVEIPDSADLNSATAFSFYETLNASGCPDSQNPLGTQCDDIYRITATELNPITFTFDGFVYSIDFALIPGPSFDAQDIETANPSLVCPSFFGDPRCAQATVPDGELWVFTPELNPGTTNLYIAMAWSAREVQIPAPATFGLMGLGLLGLGWFARRRKAEQA